MDKKKQFNEIFEGTTTEKVAQLEELNDDDQYKYQGEIVSDEELTMLKDERMKIWKTQNYKRQLQDFIKKTYNKDKEEITDKFAYNAYKKMFERNVMPNKSLKASEKILMHPDITVYDYNYIVDQSKKGQANIFKAQVGVITVFSLMFFKVQSMRSYLQNNIRVAVPVIAAGPLMTMWAGYRVNDYIMYKNCLKLGLINRYLTPMSQDSLKK